MNKEATEVDPDGAGISLGRLAVTLRMGWWAGAEKGALRGKQEPDKYLGQSVFRKLHLCKRASSVGHIVMWSSS